MSDTVDIQELGHELFSTTDGEINISLLTLTDNNDVAQTNIYDMHELFMNLILLGLNELDIDLHMSSLETIIGKMRPYFGRMRVAMHVDHYMIEDHDPMVQNRYTTLVPDFSSENGISFKMAMNMSHKHVGELRDISTAYYEGGSAFLLRFSLV